MEKRKYQSYFQSDQQQTQGLKNPTNSVESSYLYQLIPKQIRTKYSQSNQLDICLYNCLTNLHYHTRIQELNQLFDEVGADINVWACKPTANQKSEYLLAALDKNIQQSKKKINHQTSNYLTSLTNPKNLQQNIIRSSDKPKNIDFNWLNLNTKNQMLKGKLKTKLVQTINQFKNQKKLREVMGKQLEDHEKIHLQDDSIDLFQDEKSKMNYQWTTQDEQMFLNNIKKLKEKFIQTQFLKNCHRYKFITDSQLKTLACEQISRKLDKSNKAFLSRQFLLDKYFSTKETLTQKQMKFILKTSPLLSKCVDKAFVRAAIKNIQYQDIQKMQLQIAEQIIEKFQMIRNLVKNSRKAYKQNQNNRTKSRIQKFQKMKKQQQIRQQMKSKLDIHKVKLIRNLNFRPQSAQNSQNSIKRYKQNHDSIFQKDCRSPKKLIWPIPMNSHHPATGLFIKDSNQIMNDQYNQYQKSYLKQIYKSQGQNNSIVKDSNAKIAMIKFYTGGPQEPCFSNRRIPLNHTNAFHKITNKKSNFDKNILKTLCQAFKVVQYRRQLLDKLNTIELQSQQQDVLTDRKTTTQITKRTKKSDESDHQQSPKNRGNDNQMEKALKDRIIQGKQKAKVVVYVKKLLSLAAQNSFLSLKALNAKFTPSQVNSLDSRGNTALYYATKNKNSDFIDYLLSIKADVNVKCFKGSTPLHNIFKSSDYSLICKCLTGPVAPNLNILDQDNKTPLGYCCRKVLQMLGLQTGVVWVAQGQQLKFDNNSLLCKNLKENSPCEKLQMKIDIGYKNNSKVTTTRCL